ncbi:MAG: AtpZ/AtpI family protein [Candidatus Aminicenantales bacterium]
MAKKRAWKIESRKILLLSSLGLMLPSSIAVGLFLGYFLDKILKTHPWMLLTFLLLGTASGLYSLFQGLSRLKNEDRPDKPEDV